MSLKGKRLSAQLLGVNSEIANRCLFRLWDGRDQCVQGFCDVLTCWKTQVLFKAVLVLSGTPTWKGHDGEETRDNDQTTE